MARKDVFKSTVSLCQLGGRVRGKNIGMEGCREGKREKMGELEGDGKEKGKKEGKREG